MTQPLCEASKCLEPPTPTSLRVVVTKAVLWLHSIWTLRILCCSGRRATLALLFSGLPSRCLIMISKIFAEPSSEESNSSDLPVNFGSLSAAESAYIKNRKTNNASLAEGSRRYADV